MLKLVQRGDESAFAELYDELTALVYGTILRVVRDPAMSEEVAQEVFLELWRTAPRFDPSRGNVRTWAATISHRRAVDRVRSVDAARRRDDAEAIDLTTTPPQPEAELERTFDQERVRRGLESLTTVQRQAIELAYYKGLTYREVATALDLPEGTIKTRIRDGMIRLRDHLGVGDD
ncbi:MAG: ECF RNA polymerase sigma factor SigK [Acidimicrobiales bacterium]